MSRLRRGAVALGATLLALGGAELFVRDRLIRKSGATDFASLRDRYLGRDLGIFTRDESGELDLVPARSQGSKIRINEQGMRGAPARDPKPEGGFRVACIGGSGCFGTMSSSDETTFPAALEKALRAAARDPAATEVVNAGLPGASTARAVSRLESRVTPLHPDVVILYNLINDLLTSRRVKLGLDERQRPLVPADGAISELLSHSAIWLAWRSSRTLAEKEESAAGATRRELEGRPYITKSGGPSGADAVKQATAKESAHVYDGTPATNLYLVPEHMTEFGAQLRRFARAARAAGAEPVFCTFALRFKGDEDEATYREEGPATAFYMPDWAMARDAVAYMNDGIREVARETGSKLIDVARDLPRKPEYFAPKDTDHFTDAGCEAVGELLAKGLRSQGLLRGAALHR